MKETYLTAYLQDNFLWSHTGIPLSLGHISLLLRHNFCHRLIGNENIEATYIVSHIKHSAKIPILRVWDMFIYCFIPLLTHIPLEHRR